SIFAATDHCTGSAVRAPRVSVKRVVRTYRHIKTSWCSSRRVAHLGMAAAWNRYAAHNGASNLWLCSSGSPRVTLVVPRRRAGRYQRECKHNGRNNGYDCFHASAPRAVVDYTVAVSAQWPRRAVCKFAEIRSSWTKGQSTERRTRMSALGHKRTF